MWGGVGGITAPFTDLEEAMLANYEYIVFTANLSDFNIDTSKKDGNYGVNIQIPNVQKSVTNNTANSDGTRTYYIKISEFGDAPVTATEFALIVGGSGKFVLTELYLAVDAEDDPLSLPVTGITISPVSANIAKNGTKQFTVRNSKFKNVTSDTIFTLSGTASEASDITEDGLLTVGETSGDLTVTATYTAEGKDFTAEAKITVLDVDEMVNLITSFSVDSDSFYLAPGWDKIENADTNNVQINGQTISFTLPAGLVAQWQAQLKIITDANLSEGDEWYFSCKFNGVTGGYTIKLNDSEDLCKQMTGSIEQGGITVSASGTVEEKNYTNLSIMFDFGTCSEGTLVISDIILAKIN